jgi:hypothetical protein
MVSLVLTIIAFAAAMGVPVFLTAIVESAFKVRPPSSRIRASRRTNWTDRHWLAEIVIKRTSIGQSLTDGWSVRWIPFHAKDGPHRERKALTTKEKKSNWKRSSPLETAKEVSCKPATGDQNETLRLLASCSYRKGDQNVECVL